MDTFLLIAVIVIALYFWRNSKRSARGSSIFNSSNVISRPGKHQEAVSPSRSKNAMRYQKTGREELGAVIKYAYEIPLEDLGDGEYIAEDVFIEIPKDPSGYKATIYEKSSRDDSSTYNVKTKRWSKRDNIALLYNNNRIPAELTKIICDLWEKENGKISQHKAKKTGPTAIQYKSTLVRLNCDRDALSSLPEFLREPGSGGKSYPINLPELLCSCPDFKKRRAKFQNTDIRRICKHQARAIQREKTNVALSSNSLIPAMVDYFATIGKGITLFEYVCKVEITEEIAGPNHFFVFVCQRDFPWVNIFIPDSSYSRYGYNSDERRWAYGKNPFPVGTANQYNKAIRAVVAEFIR